MFGIRLNRARILKPGDHHRASAKHRLARFPRERETLHHTRSTDQQTIVGQQKNALGSRNVQGSQDGAGLDIAKDDNIIARHGESHETIQHGQGYARLAHQIVGHRVRRDISEDIRTHPGDIEEALANAVLIDRQPSQANRICAVGAGTQNIRIESRISLRAKVGCRRVSAAPAPERATLKRFAVRADPDERRTAFGYWSHQEHLGLAIAVRRTGRNKRRTHG